MSLAEKKSKKEAGKGGGNAKGYRAAYRAFKEGRGRRPTAFMYCISDKKAQKIRSEIDPLFSL